MPAKVPVVTRTLDGCTPRNVRLIIGDLVRIVGSANNTAESPLEERRSANPPRGLVVAPNGADLGVPDYSDLRVLVRFLETGQERWVPVRNLQRITPGRSTSRHSQPY